MTAPLSPWYRATKIVRASAPAGQDTSWRRAGMGGEGPGPARELDLAAGNQEIAPAAEPDAPALTDTDMLPIESLDESSDYSPFLSPKVSQELRRRALRRLFGLPRFQGTDGLNDYDEDYRRFTALGDMITHGMRRRLEMEVERAHQAADREEDETPPVVVVKTVAGDEATPDVADAEVQAAPDPDVRFDRGRDR